MRNVIFVDLIDRPNIGSTTLRTYQLSELVRPHFARHSLDTSVSTTLQHHASLLVLNKSSVLRCSPADIRDCVKRGNLVALDPLDAPLAPEMIAESSLLIASSFCQYGDFKDRNARGPNIYVGHHVDTRIPVISPPTDRLRLGYFGEIANAAHVRKLSDIVNFRRTDTRNADECSWMEELALFNAHYALRNTRPFDGHKPFTKGFIAAHCGCPILLDIRDEEALRHLTSDYPYFADVTAVRSVEMVIERMSKGFQGEEWRRAQKVMTDLRAKCSTDSIARKFASDVMKFLN